MGITDKFSTDTNTTKWFSIWDSLKANVAQTQKQIILPFLIHSFVLALIEDTLRARLKTDFRPKNFMT